MKNVVKLNHDYLPLELEADIRIFNERFHESLDNLPPAVVFLGWAKKCLDEPEKIKKNRGKKS